MEPSIFTKIINGEIPSHSVYEDDNVFAFLDIHPAVEGHLLVVSKKQVQFVWDLDDEDYQKVWKSVKLIAKNLQQAMGTSRVVVKVEGFDVDHAHIHLLPANEFSDMKKQDFSAEPDHEKLSKLADKIKGYF